jgi:Trk-type K+ transport system membrane component
MGRLDPENPNQVRLFIYSVLDRNFEFALVFLVLFLVSHVD